jgi:hypothetical protein
VNRASYLMTDESAVYTEVGREFSGHGTVNHSAEEYVRAFFWPTNTVENYFSILKRGIIGVYHHVSETHLYRYAAEFDFRYNHRVNLSKPPANGRWNGLFAWDEGCGGKHGGKIDAHG